MQPRLAALIGTTVLILAIPASADSIFYSAATPDSPDTPDSAKMIRKTDAKRVTLPAVEVTPSLESVVAPGWTDAAPYDGITEYVTHRATVHDMRDFALVLDEPLSDAAPAEPAFAMFSMGGFQPAGGFGGNSSGRSVILSELESNGRASTFLTDGKDLHSKGRDRDGADKGKKKNQDGSDSVPVPEPAAFSLVLLGLATVGIMARRSRDFPPSA